MAANSTVLIPFGPSANCNRDLCPLEWSVLRYLPNIPANATFIGVFGFLLVVHLVQGVRYQLWNYMACMATGCGIEIAGYVGRIMLYNNPFDFNAFLINLGKHAPKRSAIAWARTQLTMNSTTYCRPGFFLRRDLRPVNACVRSPFVTVLSALDFIS